MPNVSSVFRRNIGALALALAMLAPIAGTSEAQVFCTKPIKPFCIDQDTTYGDERSLSECDTQVEEFVAKTDAYADCLTAQGREATEEAKKVHARFQCKKRGDQNCPEADVSF